MHYVVGDVHGCMKELQQLIDKIENQDKDATFIFVGDFIDRGPDVPAVMEWVTTHITKTGKYQSVRGNHEQEAYFWYRDCFLTWLEESPSIEEPLPETNYDFSQVVDFEYQRDPKRIEPFFNKVIKAMPLDKKVRVVSPAGEKVTYRIVHASYSYGKGVSKGEQMQTNLYKRDYWGNHNADEIIVHGHTPTIDWDYRLRGISQDRPGMICYRPKAINVDGGCCFGKYETGYACMLCAICLETLEEFYSCSLEEGIWHAAECKVDSMANFKFMKEAIANNERAEYVKSAADSIREIYEKIEPSIYRKRMLEDKLGLSGAF